MTPPPATTREQLVELIVAEVVRTLGAKAATCESKLSQEKLPGAVPIGDELRLDDTVIAVAQLEGRLSGVVRLVVPRRTIVTPAARDLLRHSCVTLDRASEALRAAANVELLLGVADTNFDPSSLLERAGRDGVIIERIAKTGLPQIVSELTEEIHMGGRRGMLLTGLGPVAVCLANRERGVRACEVRNPSDLDRALAIAGCNLAVIEPREWSLPALLRVARRLAQASCTVPQVLTDK